MLSLEDKKQENKTYNEFLIYNFLTVTSELNNLFLHKSYIISQIIQNIKISGILKIIKFSTKCSSVLIKQVIKGLLPITFVNKEKSEIPKPKHKEIVKYLNKFLYGLNIPSIGLELILLKFLNKNYEYISK